MKLHLEPTQDLFTAKPQISKEGIKALALQDAKITFLTGVAEQDLSFEDQGENGILIKKLDPEKALGHFTYDSEEGFFKHIAMLMHRPTDRELGVTDGNRAT
jgi:hypothetical protein